MDTSRVSETVKNLYPSAEEVADALSVLGHIAEVSFAISCGVTVFTDKNGEVMEHATVYAHLDSLCGSGKTVPEALKDVLCNYVRLERSKNLVVPEVEQ